MKKLLLGLLALGLTTQFYAQVVDEGTLPEIEVRATNYKSRKTFKGYGRKIRC